MSDDTTANAPEAKKRPAHTYIMSWVAALLIGLGLVTAVVLATRFGNDPFLVDSPLIGQPVPDMTFEALDGSGPIRLADLRGDITVVNFWASWCFPCRLEHPLLTEAARQFDSVNFLGVVFQDTPDRANEFLDEFGRGYPHVLDPDARGAIAFGLFGIPETYFINTDGIIVAKITGELRPGVLEDTLSRIILGERPGARTLGTVQQRQ